MARQIKLLAWVAVPISKKVRLTIIGRLISTLGPGSSRAVDVLILCPRTQPTLSPPTWDTKSAPLLSEKKRFEHIVCIDMSPRKFHCSRCEKSFLLSSALQQHSKDSASHNVCHICSKPPDYATKKELENHLEVEHNICIPCGKPFDTPRQLAQHDVAKHNMCVTCHRYFNSAGNRNSVSSLAL